MTVTEATIQDAIKILSGFIYEVVSLFANVCVSVLFSLSSVVVNNNRRKKKRKKTPTMTICRSCRQFGMNFCFYAVKFITA